MIAMVGKARPVDPEERAEYYRKAKSAILEEYKKTRNVRKAARAGGFDPTSIYRFCREDPEFKKAWDDGVSVAKEYRADEIREEMFRRGVKGVMVPVVSGGKIVTRVREYSDMLLARLAPMYCPEAKEKIDVTANFSKDDDLDLSKLSNDELATMIALKEKARRDKSEGAEHGDRG